MPWIKKSYRHVCVKPDEEVTKGEVEEGSIWKCALCEKVYKVGYSRYTGSWYFYHVINYKEDSA